MVAGIGAVLAKLTEAAGEIITTIWEELKQLPGKALEWGKDMINGFIDGIKGMVGNIGSAASGIADKVKGFLHFSRPDEGPLRDYETWMPDMVEGLSKTLEKSSPKLYNASEKLANKLASGLDITKAYNKMQSAINLETAKLTSNISAEANIKFASGNGQVIENNNDNGINVTQNFYEKTESPYEIAKQTKNTLRRVAYGI